MPLFVFIFIYTFGEHHFTLKSFFPVLDKKGEVLRNEEGDTVFQVVPDFTLTDQAAGSFSQQDLKDKIYVMNFFFTDCPGMCKKMSSQLVRVQENLQNIQTVELVSISVKPREDSVQALQNYAKSYKADTTQWHFLTGNRNVIYSLAQKGFSLPLHKTGGPEDFIHSDNFMLVDKNHVVRGVYKGTEVKEVDRMIMEINVLLDEYSKSK
ncbi:SCO family protein [Pontibacter sp. H259]|uniref:SCO family protein n=1 Tax=Pontibacter sp. H259 TaxID=3133421 RepID=UPI0030BA8AE2